MWDLAASALRLRSSYAGSDSLPSTGANCISPTETWWKNGRTSAITKWNLPIPIINSQRRGEMGGSPATVSIKQCRSHPTLANCISSGRAVFNIQHVTKETVMKLECATSAYVHIIYIHACMHTYIHTFVHALVYLNWKWTIPIPFCFDCRWAIGIFHWQIWFPRGIHPETIWLLDLKFHVLHKSHRCSSKECSFQGILWKWSHAFSIDFSQA